MAATTTGTRLHLIQEEITYFAYGFNCLNNTHPSILYLQWGLHHDKAGKLCCHDFRGRKARAPASASRCTPTSVSSCTIPGRTRGLRSSWTQIIAATTPGLPASASRRTPRRRWLLPSDLRLPETACVADNGAPTFVTFAVDKLHWTARPYWMCLVGGGRTGAVDLPGRRPGAPIPILIAGLDLWVRRAAARPFKPSESFAF